MIVKWVCSVCGSNHLQESAPVMQCSVCGTIRTTEPVVRVDSHVVDTAGVEESKVDLTQGKHSYIRLLSLLAYRFSRTIIWLLRLLMLCAFVAVGYLLYRDSFAAFIEQLLQNNEALLSPDRLTPYLENAAFLLSQSWHNTVAMVKQNSKLPWNHLISFIRRLTTEKTSGTSSPSFYAGNIRLLWETQSSFWRNAGTNWARWLENLGQYLAVLFVNLEYFFVFARFKISELAHFIINKVRSFL